MTRTRRILLIALGIPVALAVLGMVGSFLYIHFIESDPPARLTLDTPTGSTGSAASGAASSSSSTDAAPSGSVDGTWKVTGDSIVGYRVQETLFGQANEAAGRTSAVTGSFTITGNTVADASFEVQMAKVTSDESQRDGQFRNRIMNVSRFPTATFKLTAPITLPSVPTDSSKVEVDATGDLTLHGTTRSVTIALKAQRSGTTVKVNGSLKITFADYGIDNPSGGPASVGDDGELEVLLVLSKQ